MSEIHAENPFLAQIYLEIARRPLFEKYAFCSSEPILHILKLEEEIRRFSWGNLYIQIHKLGRAEETLPSIEIAADLELVGLASRMLDNLVDEDDPHIEQRIGRANTLLLFTEILVESFGRLQRLIPNASEEIQQHLMSALSGEWADINRTALDGIGEQEYMRRILPKTSSIFKLAALCGDPDRMGFWREFMDYASLALQLANDMAALYAEAKSDLSKLRPTLPILKTVDVEDARVKEERSRILRAYAAGQEESEKVRAAIEESGSLEYCYLVRELHKEKCREMLSEEFTDRLVQTEALFRLLQLEAL
ncbi:polyprenyl synthetase family protein [Saccharibacillus sp. O23]|uniref:polyprenyl synthetase family protein n=1 Tax=Saccharibacillus sp. O23 TaxID=2009338 RepID=UPI00117B822D|nr:polyprenyl synthetase family protein [Saccharibacillus sp. O23]